MDLKYFRTPKTDVISGVSYWVIGDFGSPRGLNLAEAAMKFVANESAGCTLYAYYYSTGRDSRVALIQSGPSSGHALTVKFFL